MELSTIEKSAIRADLKDHGIGYQRHYRLYKLSLEDGKILSKDITELEKNSLPWSMWVFPIFGRWRNVS